MACLAGLLATVPAPDAASGERVVVGVNRDGIVSYDPGEVSRQDRQVVRAWIRLDMAPEDIEEAVKARPRLADLAYAKQLVFIDCAAAAYTLRHKILYSDSGAVLDQTELKAGPAELRKDAVIEALAKDVCSR